jgi:hypothetical protein
MYQVLACQIIAHFNKTNCNTESLPIVRFASLDFRSNLRESKVSVLWVNGEVWDGGTMERKCFPCIHRFLLRGIITHTNRTQNDLYKAEPEVVSQALKHRFWAVIGHHSHIFLSILTQFN